MQIVDGEPRPGRDQAGQGQRAVSRPATRRSSAPCCRSATRCATCCAPRRPISPWAEAQVRLRIAYSSFVRSFGPINHTVVSVTTDPETGEERETHRRPNLAPFADDPDCWLVASIEDYDLESGLARMGPIFRERVIAPPAAPLIATAADALAVTLERDRPRRSSTTWPSCWTAIRTPRWPSSAKRSSAIPAPRRGRRPTPTFRVPCAPSSLLPKQRPQRDPQYARNVAALRRVQPEDIASVGHHRPPGRSLAPDRRHRGLRRRGDGHRDPRPAHGRNRVLDRRGIAPFVGTAAGTSEWGTSRRHAGWLLHDALNSATPQIFDTVIEDGVEKRVLNSEATEAAKEKLAQIKDAFTAWVWTDPDRTDRLARLYNDRFNNLVPRHFDGTPPDPARRQQHHPLLRAPEAGDLAHRRGRLTYIAHTVGAGKPSPSPAAIMEQKRLGLISKAMLVVPGHCLAQASREFLQLYPTARILVADETNFVKEKRSRFLARAATANWDADHHHPRGVPLHPGAGRLRARDDRGPDRLLRGAHAARR